MGRTPVFTGVTIIKSRSPLEKKDAHLSGVRVFFRVTWIDYFAARVALILALPPLSSMLLP